MIDFGTKELDEVRALDTVEINGIRFTRKE